jgi:regulator of RNase E activity RraA
MIDLALLNELGKYSTPSILNGLKRLGRKPEELESMDRTLIHCMSPHLGVRIGYAVTRKIATRRSGGPSKVPPGTVDQGLLEVPSPRFLVVENVGDWRGPVCIWGELAANINVALGCTAGVTNGPVRDLPEMEALGFQSFAGGAAPGGGYVDVLEISCEVVVGGVTVKPGDLIHADRHGIVKVPIKLAPQLPDAIRQVESFERGIVDICQSPEFTVEKLAAAMKKRD